MYWPFTSQVNMRGSSGHACSRPVVESDDWMRTTSAVAGFVEHQLTLYNMFLWIIIDTHSRKSYYCYTWICVGIGYNGHYCDGSTSNNHLHNMLHKMIGKFDLVIMNVIMNKLRFSPFWWYRLSLFSDRNGFESKQPTFMTFKRIKFNFIHCATACSMVFEANK